MSTLVSEVIAEVKNVLVDKNFKNWTLPELVQYMQRGLQSMASKRPEAFLRKMTMSSDSTHLSLPSSGVRFVSMRDVEFAVTPRRTTTDELDKNIPNWQRAVTTQAILAYAPDPHDPKKFYVYPKRPNSGSNIEVTYVTEPSKITYTETNGVGSNDSLFDCPDQFVPPLVSYILARAFGRDDEVGAQNLALAYMQDFNNYFAADKTYT